MKKILISIVLIFSLFLGDIALQAKLATDTAATVEPTPWVVKKKFNFWEWLLGPRKPKPTPTPAPTSTPKPTPSRHRVRKSKPAEPKATRTPRPSVEKTPAPRKEKSKPAPVVEETPAPAATPEPSAAEPAATPAPAAEATPPPTESTEPSTAEPSVPAISSAQEAKERAQYRTVRAKALEDKHIQDLRDQMDAAVGDEQRQKATKRYYNALFEKMRDIDPSLKERINRMEAAAKRRMARSNSGESSDE